MLYMLTTGELQAVVSVRRRLRVQKTSRLRSREGDPFLGSPESFVGLLGKSALRSGRRPSTVIHQASSINHRHPAVVQDLKEKRAQSAPRKIHHAQLDLMKRWDALPAMKTEQISVRLE